MHALAQNQRNNLARLTTQGQPYSDLANSRANQHEHYSPKAANKSPIAPKHPSRTAASRGCAAASSSRRSRASASMPCCLGSTCATCLRISARRGASPPTCESQNLHSRLRQIQTGGTERRCLARPGWLDLWLRNESGGGWGLRRETASGKRLVDQDDRQRELASLSWISRPFRRGIPIM